MDGFEIASTYAQVLENLAQARAAVAEGRAQQRAEGVPEEPGAAAALDQLETHMAGTAAMAESAIRFQMLHEIDPDQAWIEAAEQSITEVLAGELDLWEFITAAVLTLDLSRAMDRLPASAWTGLAEWLAAGVDAGRLDRRWDVTEGLWVGLGLDALNGELARVGLAPQYPPPDTDALPEQD